MLTTAARRASHFQAARTATTAAITSSGTAPSGISAPATERSRGPQPRSLSLPSARPGSADTSALIFPDASTPRSRMPVGHIFRGVHVGCRAAAAAPPRRRPPRRAPRPATAGRCNCRSVRTAPPPGRPAPGAGSPSGTRWWRCSRASPAARGPARRRRWRTGRHRRPSPAGRCPAAGHAPDGAVDVQDLQHHLQPGRATGRPVSPARPSTAGAPPREHRQRAAHHALGREGQRAEVSPDVSVLAAGQQDDVGAVHAPARPADLLVVGDGRLRRAEMDDEAEVRLVESHAQRARRHEGLDLDSPAARLRRPAGRPDRPCPV